MIRALLLALALAGCEGQVHVASVPIAQADPTTEADWPGLNEGHSALAWRLPARADSLTVTNATAHTLLLEQAHVVTLAKPGGTYCVELGGPVTICEEGSYDE